MSKVDKTAGRANKEIEELKTQIEGLTEALQRERADSVNLRRRVEEDRSKMADFYKAQVVRELLPALDNLERAVHHRPKVLASDQWAAGIDVISHQLEKILNELGVKRIKTKDQIFDPKYHEAVSVDQDSEGDTEVVANELQAGYTLGDEVIRHAAVRVKMRPGNNEQNSETENHKKEDQNG